MKVSISNIGWDADKDIAVYKLMNAIGFQGLEIAPTRIFPEKPYEKLNDASTWSEKLKREFGLSISSIQSLWYGRQEKIFNSSRERAILVDYTKSAIEFASAIGCKNLVFGCPRNRSVPDRYDDKIAISFFREIGDYAASKAIVVGMEANPPIYKTNFINDTISALVLIDQVNSEGFKLNLDLGTVIYNGEDILEIEGKVSQISHVHISEPGLKPIEQRKLHVDLKEILIKENYQGYVSIEMEKVENISTLEETMRYVKETFS